VQRAGKQNTRHPRLVVCCNSCDCLVKHSMNAGKQSSYKDEKHVEQVHNLRWLTCIFQRGVSFSDDHLLEERENRAKFRK
jgi:hypothetical protein